jgi:membrane fusion protein (multidrug efflux system)
MKTISKIMLSLITIAIIASCGDKNSPEAKKAQLEKLKAQQAELTSQITTLQDEIAASGDSTNKEDEKGRLVAVTTIQPVVYEHNIDVQGRIDGDENITLTSKMGGEITRVNVKAGDRVSKGQVLAEIENDVIKAQLSELRTSYELANNTYERQKALWDQKVGSEMQYLQAKSNKESLEQRIKQVNETISLYTFVAPFSGTVDEVTLKVGQIVAPGMMNAYVRVVNFDKLKIKTDLSESYASQVKIGDAVKLTFPDINKTTISRVTYAAKVINASSRTFGVEIALPSSDDYSPNMIAVVSITDYKNNQAITVPINAVQTADGSDYVFVAVKEGKNTVAKKRTVKVGSMYKNTAEILSGLSIGDEVITTGYQEVNDGEIIKL